MKRHVSTACHWCHQAFSTWTWLAIALPARLASEKNASVPSAYFRCGACLRRAVSFADGLQLRLRVPGQTCCLGPCAWFYLILWTTPASYTKAYQKHRNISKEAWAWYCCFRNFQPTRPQVVAALLSTLVVLDFAPKKERMMCFATWSLISKGIRIRFFLDVARLSWSIPESDQAAQSCVISVISWQSPVLSILVLHDQRLRSDFWSQLSLQLLPSLLLVTLQLKLETLG